MKRIAVVLMVLAMASTAGAGQLISVNGQVNPPDSTVLLMPSDMLTIGIYSNNAEVLPFSSYMVVQGPGTLAGGTPLSGGLSSWNIYTDDDIYVPWMRGVFGDDNIRQVGVLDYADISPEGPLPIGLILDGVTLHGDSFGDISMSWFSMNDEGTAIEAVWDTQVIHAGDVPEPMTMALLGIGGLFLRRRK